MARNSIRVLIALISGTHVLLAGESGKNPAQTLAQWIANLKKESAALDAQMAGTDFESIRLGAGICGANHPGKTAKTQGDTKTELAVEKFKTFMSDKDLALLRKWRKGDTLTAEDDKFLRFDQFLFISAANKDHRDQKMRKFVLPLTPEEFAEAEAYKKLVEKNGKDLLVKIYNQTGVKKLTAEEVETLRLFHLSNNADCVMSIDYLPFMLDLAPLSRRAPAAGFEMPDFRLPTLESVLQRPAYTDLAPYQLFMEAPLRPDGVVEILSALSAYEPDAQGKVVPSPSR